MKKSNLKTFCPLPWMHLSANPSGAGRICCEGYELLKNDDGQVAFWKNSQDLHSYFNSEQYKKTRLQMLSGKRPSHCSYCFDQEDHGVKSVRERFIDQYKKDIDFLIKNTHSDGSVDHPHILYIDMALGNKCNLKCRMCTPWSSYLIGQDWEKMGKSFDKKTLKRIVRDEWYSSSGFFSLIRESLPSVRAIFTTGGEPLLVKEHLQILEMIVEEGHADHILLRYNSNQTVIPKKIVQLWQKFQKVDFNCSVEAFGEVNDYIRYPSKWSEQEKNIYYLDEIASQSSHIDIYIHTTLQVYNVTRIPELLNWLREADFKALHRFPYFIWVRIPKWLCPGVYPKSFRSEVADKILESLDHHENFFLNYNNGSHRNYSRDRIRMLREFAGMIRNDSSQEGCFEEFIKETKAHDTLRNQSVIRVLPELSPFFSDCKGL